MTNRLAAETSPYLRQHAGNPVDWWPWCADALAAARAENKPILLSIGYAACHWCHVMAHESFEDEATARVMNALYVNIKVDREERPDLDKVYQLAHQALARRGGGWPLTVFLTPDDLMPFFAGTYFPKAPRYGMPAFVQVLEGVRAWFDEKPTEVRTQNASLATFLDRHAAMPAHGGALDDRPIRAAIERIAVAFDDEHGGRRGAPKFPHASEIELLLSRHARAHEPATRDPVAMARFTLNRMAEGGLQDHVGGGFFRYAVDERWEIPHFEKMLYDNALLLPLYARCAEDDTLAVAARDCADWLVEDMSAAGGGFSSSLDADSEGGEGAYYVWDRARIRELLDDAQYAIVERRFALDRAPNFESEAWHLRAAMSFDAVAEALSIDVASARRLWSDARARLRADRARRPRPGLDDKILTAWNALAIAAAARTGSKPLLDAAEGALDLVHAELWKDGRLHATHARGATKLDAYLDDHAFLLDALLAMLKVRWRRRDLELAIRLADTLLERFEDPGAGGFFFTANDAEPLPARPKPFTDESLPSGNGVAARALIALGHLLGEPRWLDAAERTLRAAWPLLAEYPDACAALLLALGDHLDPPPHLVIRYSDAASLARWRSALDATDAAPEAIAIPLDAGGLPGALAAPPGDREAAYLCIGARCGAPIETPDELARALRDEAH